jgi:hypothetical protein
MADAAAQRAWVKSILGVDVGGAETGPGGTAAPHLPGPEASKAWREARQAWDDAIDDVNKQIANLQTALKKTDDSQLHEIAEFGLNGVTGNQRTKLMAVIMELGDGSPERLAKHGGRALERIEALRAHLDSSGQVAVCDRNPFGVQVSIRATLGGALDRMERALAA